MLVVIEQIIGAIYKKNMTDAIFKQPLLLNSFENGEVYTFFQRHMGLLRVGALHKPNLNQLIAATKQVQESPACIFSYTNASRISSSDNLKNGNILYLTSIIKEHFSGASTEYGVCEIVISPTLLGFAYRKLPLAVKTARLQTASMQYGGGGIDYGEISFIRTLATATVLSKILPITGDTSNGILLPSDGNGYFGTFEPDVFPDTINMSLVHRLKGTRFAASNATGVDINKNIKPEWIPNGKIFIRALHSGPTLSASERRLVDSIEESARQLNPAALAYIFETYVEGGRLIAGKKIEEKAEADFDRILPQWGADFQKRSNGSVVQSSSMSASIQTSTLETKAAITAFEDRLRYIIAGENWMTFGVRHSSAARVRLDVEKPSDFSIG